MAACPQLLIFLKAKSALATLRAVLESLWRLFVSTKKEH